MSFRMGAIPLPPSLLQRRQLGSSITHYGAANARSFLSEVIAR